MTVTGSQRELGHLMSRQFVNMVAVDIIGSIVLAIRGNSISTFTQMSQFARVTFTDNGLQFFALGPKYGGIEVAERRTPGRQR